MRALQIATTITVLLTGIIAILFETGVLQEGLRAGCGVTEQYVIDALSALSVVGCVPIAVKSSTRPWFRWVLLSLPVLMDLTFYYLYFNSLSLPCAGIVGVALIMLWPRDNSPEIW